MTTITNPPIIHADAQSLMSWLLESCPYHAAMRETRDTRMTVEGSDYLHAADTCTAFGNRA